MILGAAPVDFPVEVVPVERLCAGREVVRGSAGQIRKRDEILNFLCDRTDADSRESDYRRMLCDLVPVAVIAGIRIVNGVPNTR